MDTSVMPESAIQRPSLSHGTRRRSLPAPSTKRHPKTGRAHGRRLNLEPASPEVISSLISSLSAISFPANEHFEESMPRVGISQSTPASPNAFRTTFGSRPYVPRGSASAPFVRRTQRLESDAESYYDSIEYLHPDDAAAASPVIRTSRRSSTQFSSDGAPSNGGDLTGFWKKYVRGTGGANTREHEDQDLNGGLDVDPLDARRRSSTSKGWSGSEPAKAKRNQNGLVQVSSKERLNENGNQRQRASVGTTSNEIAGLGLDNLGGSGGSYLSASAAAYVSNPKTRPTQSEVLGKEDVDARVEGTNADHKDAAGKVVPARDSSFGKGSSSNTAVHRRSSQGNTDTPGKESNGMDSDRQPREQPGSRRQGVAKATQPEVSVLADGAGKTAGRKPPESSSTSESLNKAQSPVESLSIATSRVRTGELDAQDLQLGKVGDKGLEEKDDSAPSPAILQRKTRDNSSYKPNVSSSLNPGNASSSAKTSLDSPRTTLSNAPRRRSSRLRRRSQHSDSRSTQRHTRTFSNPLRHNSAASATPTPSQVVVDDRLSTADSIEDAVDAYLRSPRLSQKIHHPETGRVISFSEVGDSEGFAVFCCVGMGLTRYITAFYDELALTLRLRLITPDRPGVGESESYADGTGTPLSWPDDVYAICQALKITKFSILAHSAGAIYALATALRMPQQIRGRIHLLAPWIPPSQLSAIGSQQEFPHAAAVPTSQRILRALPTPILKVANSNFMSATSSSITSSLPKSPRRKRKGVTGGGGGRETPGSTTIKEGPTGASGEPRDSLMYPRPGKKDSDDPLATGGVMDVSSLPTMSSPLADRERQLTYDSRLAHAIWDLATTGANPAVDLLVCLERRQPIGFRYVDITRTVVIHHGSRDTRVPVENVRWLGKTMRRCEVRVLDGEGHGLMASASVMGSVLMEIAREWEDWTKVVDQARGTTVRRMSSSGKVGDK